MTLLADIPTRVSVVELPTAADPHVTGMVPETDLDLLFSPAMANPVLNYTYNNINLMIKKNSFDLLSGTTTPLSCHHLNWTPPPFSTPPPISLAQPLSPVMGKGKLNSTHAEIVHCQPVKCKSASIVSYINETALEEPAKVSKLHFIYPQFPQWKVSAIIIEAKAQHLNTHQISSFIGLFALKDLHPKLKLLSIVFNDYNDNVSENGNFIDPSLDDALIISELTNIKAYSILIPKDANFQINKNSPLFNLKSLNFMNGYFRSINPLAYNSSYFLYRETFIRVFTLLSLVDSISPYIKYKTHPNVVDESKFIDSLCMNLSSEDIKEIKLSLSLIELDSYLIDRLISIMWLNEDQTVKNAFEL